MSAASLPPRSSRPFDVVLYGASGYTGQLAAQHLSAATGRGSRTRPLKWAIAGRDLKKLEKVKEMLMADGRALDEPAILTANADDPKSLKKMAAQTRVVLTTVGPFTRYGEPLVAACIATGTDYVDSTGESSWVAAMIEKYQADAAKAGAALVSMCGFDSVPSDLGAFLVANELKTKYKTNTKHMQGYTSIKGGGVSGGTIASMVELIESPDPKARKASGDPYALNPPNTRPTTKRSVEADQLLPRWDDLLERYTSPWLMATVNTRVARRSLALRRQLDPKGEGFGPAATYNECIPNPSLLHALLQWALFAASIFLLVLKPTRVLLTRFVLPKPGEGPSQASREATRFHHRVVGTGENGQKVQSVIAGGDPGYTDTGRMLAECALLLAEDRAQLDLQTLVPQRGESGFPGGFFTPSVMGGLLLAERLRQAGMGVTVGEFNAQTKASKPPETNLKPMKQPISWAK